MRTRPYQRRRKRPVAVVVAVLAVIAVATWTTVLFTAGGAAGSLTCPPTAAGSPPGESLDPDALDDVAPIAPAAVRIRVLNAGGQRGQANLVAAQFGDLGFAEASPPANDPFYPDSNMECVGQVRFGPAGDAAASTVSLVLPCAELVRDGRTDDTVDVSVGTAFGDLNPVAAARDALEQLAAPPTADATADPVVAATNPPGPPTADPADLEKARAATC